jgi:hypothetical protein
MRGRVMTLTNLEQRVLDIKERIRLFRLTYPHIFTMKEKDKPEIVEERPRRRTLRDIERERGIY